MTVVHLLLWSLGDSKTSLDELRAQLPPLDAPSTWLSNEATDRFGLVAFGDVPDIDRVVLERRDDFTRRPPNISLTDPGRILRERLAQPLQLRADRFTTRTELSCGFVVE